MKRLFLAKEQLEQLYYGEGLSQSQIAIRLLRWQIKELQKQLQGRLIGGAE